jgi:2-keto-4-pentenoate hydratase/2-oxohepta-3-ene-1,7-dioic acid hydratase in catechol pathway
MRIVRYAAGSAIAVGVRVGEQVLRVGHPTLIDLIRADAGAMTEVRRAVEGGGVEFTDYDRLLCPLERPTRLFFCGVNYSDHVAEVPNRSYPTEPSIFMKAVVALTGPGDPIVLPREGLGPDYEAELGLVIGRRTSRVSPEEALEHVFGYTVVNDVSARVIQFEHGQLMLGKGIDTFCPIGPEVVTADEIGDPLALRVRAWVNDELRQDAPTANMIFKPQEIISFISSTITLEPGDVISTGTPAGVGGFKDPPSYLEPGDEVSVEVDRIGRLTNPVVAAW